MWQTTRVLNMKRKLLITLLLFSITLISCNRLKNEGKKFYQSAKQKAKQKSENLSDKIFPKFDSYKPDTRFNKIRYRDFLHLDVSPDVHNLYCHSDAIGIDATYQFAFNCNTYTAKRIIAVNKLKLQKDSNVHNFGFQTEFDWWKEEDIQKLRLYSWKGEGEYYRYFWYDEKQGKGYFLDFDL